MNGGAIQQSRFATRDLEEGEDYIRQVYVDSRLRLHGSTGEFGFSSSLLMFGGVFVGGTRTTIGATIEAPDGAGRIVIFSSRRPLRIGPTGQHHSVAADDATCIPLHTPYQSNWGTLESELVSFEPGLLQDVAATQLDAGQSLEFAFDRAVSSTANETWRRVSGLVRNVAAANTDGDLLADELARLLASTALTCFPNTTMADLHVTPTPTTPESLQRAVAFIDANLDRPLSLTAIAEAARVSPRALNATFNRYHEMPVMSYVRRARLDRAHHDLKNARPGESVTEIAARWGFYSLPRFGVHYRRAYGQPPSRTLRHS